MAADIGNISSAACIAARKLLGWSHLDLARWALCSTATVKSFEGGKKTTTIASRSAIQRAFEDAGVEFIKPPRGRCKVRMKERIE